MAVVSEDPLLNILELLLKDLSAYVQEIGNTVDLIGITIVSYRSPRSKISKISKISLKKKTRSI